MYREIGIKGNGKTRRLLEYAKNNNFVVVCNRPRAMHEKAKNYGLGEIKCISYAEYLKTNCKTNYLKVVVDELEQLLTIMNIEGYTLGVEENEI